MGRTFSFSWSSTEAAYSVESAGETSRQFGIPRTCYCGLNPVLLSADSSGNLGRRYYACKNRDAGGCHIRKWWDDAVMEEFQEIKMEKESLEDRIRYINTDCEGGFVDPRMMWNSVIESRDEVNRLHWLSAAAEAQVEELRVKVEELQHRAMSLELGNTATVVREMKILVAIAVAVALVACLIVVFK